jgi:hypothetical protein
MRTPLFFGTETVPKDARYRYGFTVTETRFAGPKGTIQISEQHDATDTLNPDNFGGLAVLALPAAPPQLYIIASDSVPHGKLTPTSFKSAKLKEERTITLYTPPGDGTTPADLLIVFDGGTYDGTPSSLIPTPTILDNLIAAKKIGPTVAVFINNMGQRNRELGGYAPFADFLAFELIPWVRANYQSRMAPTMLSWPVRAAADLPPVIAPTFTQISSATFSRSRVRSGLGTTIPILLRGPSLWIRAT